MDCSESKGVVDQGSTAPAVGSGDGAGSDGTGSGLLWARGTAGSGLESHGCAARLRSRSSGRGGEQGTGAAGPRHCTEGAHGRGL